ncbi:MAG: hypothetical protein ACRC4G_05925 [Alphaproteobacteria bacterium]
MNFEEKNLKEGIKRRGALQKQTIFLEQRHSENADPYIHPTQIEREPFKSIICTTDGRSITVMHAQLLSSNSSTISFVSLVSEPSFHDQGALGISIRGKFTGKDLSSEDFVSFSNNSEKEFLYVMAADQSNPDCTIYRKKDGRAYFDFRDGHKKIDNILNDLDQDIEFRLSHALDKSTTVSSQDLSTLDKSTAVFPPDLPGDRRYAYACLVPKKPSDGESGLIEAEIGRANLTVHQFQEQTDSLSENLIVSSYLPNVGKAVYALLTPQQGCFPLSANKGQKKKGSDGVMLVRSNFLRQLFEGRAKLSKGMYSCFGAASQPTTPQSTSTTTPQSTSTTTTPLPTVGLGYNDFGDYGHNTPPSVVSLNPDSPEAPFWRRHLPSLIGGGCAALVGLSASVAGIYYLCTAAKKKRGRNEEYDKETYPLRQISVTSSN